MENDVNPETVPPSGVAAAEIDWFLRDLVNLVNTSALEFGITLHVSGLIISGMLISGRSYFEKLGDEVASSFPSDSEAAKSLKKYFSRPADIYPAPDAEESEAATAELDPPDFIHLKDARIFHNSGKPIPTNSGVLWRGKLADVSGFVMGAMSWS